MRHDRPECLKVKRGLLWPLQPAQISNICARLCHFFLSHKIPSWVVRIKANFIKKNLARDAETFNLCAGESSRESQHIIDAAFATPPPNY